MKYIYSFIFLFLFSSSFSQGVVSAPAFANCYQQVSLGSGSSQGYNFLKSASNRIIPNGTSVPSFIQIIAYNDDGTFFFPDNIGEPGFYFGLAGGDFSDLYLTDEDNDLVYHVIEYAKYMDGVNNLIYNSNPLVFQQGMAYIDIVLFYEFSQGGNNPTPSSSVRINLLEDDEAIETGPQTNVNGCVTFDNFQTTFTNKLSGFCGTVQQTVALSPTEQRSFNISETADSDPPTFFNLNLNEFAKYCHDDCDNMGVPQGSPMTPCGCDIFVLRTKIFPCPQFEYRPECSSADPLIIEQNVEICCTCDITLWFPLNTGR